MTRPRTAVTVETTARGEDQTGGRVRVPGPGGSVERLS